MGVVFDIHKEYGRLFDERVYKRELAQRLPGTCLEVPVEVCWLSFAKRYHLDVLVEQGGLFEFKATDGLLPRDRAQTLNYLLLVDLAHAKLVNTRPNEVQHEFVNTSLRPEDRYRFVLDLVRWSDSIPGAARFRPILAGMLAEWGACLDLGLYEEALTHFLGGEHEVIQSVRVLSGDTVLAHQRMRMAAPQVAFRVTAITRERNRYHDHLLRQLRKTALIAIFWVNITLESVTLTCLRS